MGDAGFSTTKGASVQAPRSGPPDLQRDTSSLVHGLTKGLRILALLNQYDDMSVGELARSTGIPRPTVHRILNTLMAEHLISTGQRRGRYRVAIGARLLSQGYKEPVWLVDVAAPVLDRLQKRVVWPSDLATYSHASMVIRRTTSHRSPLSIVEQHVGARLPMLWSALGLAYLAACPQPVCDTIVETLSRSSRPDSALAKDQEKVARMLEQVRSRGFAIRNGGASKRSLAFAVPVLVEDRPVGALNVLLYRAAITPEKAEAEILPHLSAAAADMGERLLAAQADVLSL